MLDFVIGEQFLEDLVYEELVVNTTTNTSTYKAGVIVKGIRLKGNVSVHYGSDGDSKSSSIKYKTVEKLKVHSKLDGHEIIDVDKLNFSGGYLVYVK